MAPRVEAVARGRGDLRLRTRGSPLSLLYAGPSSSRHGFARAFFALLTVSHYYSVIKPEYGRYRNLFVMSRIVFILGIWSYTITMFKSLLRVPSTPFHTLTHTITMNV